MKNFKRILTAALAFTLVLGCVGAAGCGSKKNDVYEVGICQLVQHPALDAATQGFKDALTELLGDEPAEPFAVRQHHLVVSRPVHPEEVRHSDHLVQGECQLIPKRLLKHVLMYVNHAKIPIRLLSAGLCIATRHIAD